MWGTEAAPFSRPQNTLSNLLRGWDVLLGFLGAFAEEVSFHLLDDEVLVVFLPGLQAVLVEQHLHVIGPALPCLLADVVVDPLAERRVKGGLVESFHLLAELNAFHHVCHVAGLQTFDDNRRTKTSDDRHRTSEANGGVQMSGEVRSKTHIC